MRAYRDWFSGYLSDPADYLRRTFEEVEGYDEMIVLRGIEFESHCEHHMAPIIGRAHVGYLPTNKVVGISKLARVVDTYARRFQVQEKLTAQIAGCIDSVLRPRGVGVVIDAVHQCMTTRGVHKRGVSMVTSKMLGGVPRRRAHPRGVPALRRRRPTLRRPANYRVNTCIGRSPNRGSPRRGRTASVTHVSMRAGPLALASLPIAGSFPSLRQEFLSCPRALNRCRPIAVPS